MIIFSASIDSSMLCDLRYFISDLSFNALIGKIPTNIGKLKKLVELVATNNQLSGPVVSEIGMITTLQVLDLASNSLTGTLPSVLSGLTGLQLINISSNQIQGNLQSIFASSSEFLSSLQIFDASDNLLTGTIPQQLFQNNQLQLVILNNNCFSGTLPDGICEATSLITLILDGLTSGSQCLVEVPSALRFVLNGTFTKQHVTGRIPSCILSLERLQTLHLAGNGFIGSIIDIPSNSSLTVSFVFNRCSCLRPIEFSADVSLLSTNNFTLV